MRWDLTGGYAIDDSTVAINHDRLYEWLTTDAYWWVSGLDRQVFETAIEASVTLSVLSPAGEFVGFGRLVTDRATFANWCDVYIDVAHRGRRLGEQLTKQALSHPAIATCRRIMLATRDAHAVYERAGFHALAAPDMFMEVYRPQASAGQ